VPRLGYKIDNEFPATQNSPAELIRTRLKIV